MAHFLWAADRAMRGADKLTDLIRPAVEMLGYELVGVDFFSRGPASGLLRIYIDREGGVTVGDCGRVSHQVSGVLDVEDPIAGRYDLEVSSPGLDRPLFCREHFERFVGHEARIRLSMKLNGRRKFQGRLRGVEDDYVLIEEEDQVHRLPLGQIESARLVPEL